MSRHNHRPIARNSVLNKSTNRNIPLRTNGL
jgi:hypothetical protein